VRERRTEDRGGEGELRNGRKERRGDERKREREREINEPRATRGRMAMAEWWNGARHESDRARGRWRETEREQD